MHKIIDIVRNIKAINNISFKLPIKDIIICSNDNNFISIKYIIDYLKSESKIYNIIFDDIKKYSSLIITPNKSTIGKEFKSNSKYILKKLNEIVIQKNNININIDSFKLNKNHFIINYNIQEIQNYVHHLNQDILVYLNITSNQTIKNDYYANVITSSVQHFRKDLHLNPWDKIYINIHTSSKKLIQILQNQNKKITNIIGEFSINKNINKLKVENKEFIIEEIKYIIQIYKNS